MPVMLLFLLLLALVFAQHTIHVLLVEQQLAHLVLRVALDGGQPVKALAVRVSQGKRIAAPPDLAACLRQQLQKCVEAVRFLQKRRVYEAAEQLPVGWLQSCAAPSALRFSSHRRSGWNTTAQCQDRRSC